MADGPTRIYIADNVVKHTTFNQSLYMH